MAIGVVVVATISLWQFYMFVVFKDANGVADAQGGTIHLWLAIGLALLACVGVFFLVSGLLRYDHQNEMHITSPGAL